MARGSYAELNRQDRRKVAPRCVRCGHDGDEETSRSLRGVDPRTTSTRIPVAALVYRRRQHIINLFVWPTADGVTVQPGEGSRRGYNVVPGRSGPNQAWAVSDLNAVELREFMRLVQQPK